MRTLFLAGVLATALATPAVSAICPDELGDKALAEAGYDPDAPLTHEIKGLGTFAVPTRFKLSRRVVRGQRVDEDGKPVWAYSLKTIPKKPTSFLGFEFLMSGHGKDCRKPFVVIVSMARGELADGPTFGAVLLRKLIAGHNPKVTPVDVGEGLLRLDGATNLSEPVLMHAYVANGSALRIVDGTDKVPQSTINGLFAKRGWAVNIYYGHPDWEMWRSVLSQIEALLDRWQVK